MKISSSAARVLRVLLWQVWSWCLGLLHDWVLPERYHVQPEGLPQWLARVWARYLHYRKAACPGVLQFRGLRVDPHSIQAKQGACQGSRLVYYRGCPLKTGTSAAELNLEQKSTGALANANVRVAAFVPPYQHLLNRLRLKLQLADVDAYPAAANLQAVYRGQEV